MLAFFSDESVVLADPDQYGLFNMETSLNCSTTLDVNEFVILFNWYRGEGDSKQALPGRPHFESADISDEGVYTCEVDISAMGLTIAKTINFQVLGESSGDF